MVIRVLDHNGTVIHDCADAGCDTSWDGYAIIRDGATLTQGEPVEGRTDPDATVWKIDGDEARQL